MKCFDPFTPEEAISYALVGGTVLRRQARKHGLGSGQLHTLLCLYMLTNTQSTRYVQAGILAQAVDVTTSLFRAHIRDLLHVDLIQRIALAPREARLLGVTESGQEIARSYLLAMGRRAHIFQRLCL